MVSVQIAALLVAFAGGGETVLLDFHAPWCAPCRSMEGTISELEQAGYPVRKVNIDRERSLAAQYHVESIPCFVLLVDGKEAGRLNGAVRRSELLAMFAQARVKSGGEGLIARGQSPDAPVRPVALPQESAKNPFTRNRWTPSADAQPGTQRGAPPASGAHPSPNSLIDSSVRLTIEDPKGYSYGSGTLIDTRQGEALVLTCGHIFRDSQGKGKISVDMCGPQGRQKIAGRLIGYDLKSDIGLVSIRPGVPVSVAPVAPKGYRINAGDQVVTVGCNNGGPATAIPTKVTGIDKFLGPPNVQVAGLPVQGRSGGGLFTADGQVIGVCNAADPTDNEGLFAALAAIQNYLDQQGLTAIYTNRATAPSALAKEVPSMPERMPNAKLAARSAAADAMGGLSDAERATLAQLKQRSDSAEVICIVRSLSDPQAKSEVIMLDRASSAFLRQLAVDREAQEGRQLTSMTVPASTARPRQPSRERQADDQRPVPGPRDWAGQEGGARPGSEVILDSRSDYNRKYR